MEMEGGRRRCITEKAVELPQRENRFLLLAAVSSNFPHVDVTQHVKQCLKLQREANKKMTRCGRSTAPPPSHAKTKTSENHVLVHTGHTTYTTRTTLSCLVLSRLVSSLFSSLLFKPHIHLFRNLVEINLRQHVRWKSSTM